MNGCVVSADFQTVDAHFVLGQAADACGLAVQLEAMDDDVVLELRENSHCGNQCCGREGAKLTQAR